MKAKEAQNLAETWWDKVDTVEFVRQELFKIIETGAKNGSMYYIINDSHISSKDGVIVFEALRSLVAEGYKVFLSFGEQVRSDITMFTPFAKITTKHWL